MSEAEKYLHGLVADKKPVMVFLLNGVKLTGKIIEVTADGFLLEREGRRQLIFPHAVSTIAEAYP